MTDRQVFPPHITAANEAYTFIKADRNTPVYLKVDLGDRNEALNKSVTLYPGHEGRLEEVYLSEGVRWKVRVKIINPPGQHYSCCVLEDFHTFWTTDPKEFPQPSLLNGHQRVELDKLGKLMG